MQIDDYVSALPDSYAKSSDSNNYKLLSIEQHSIKMLETDIQALDNILDVKNASGKTLDHYGKMYGQPRGIMTDEQYRILILQRIARLFTGCDYANIVRALATVFDVSIDSFVIDELDGCKVEVKSLPYTALLKNGISAVQAREIIKTMLTVGVHLEPLELEGTFEFSVYADEYDEEASFGNVEQTVGGYFGYLQGDNTYVNDNDTTATLGVAILGNMVL
ncbi:MAG: hypothetical protein IKY67_06215 [Paludibacteraceae bacterium]|nr:hypothetical protein [Paludibacteraceae bacterium]